MKRNAKQDGAGGRLRLGLLLASVAAFLLVPVAMASAAEIDVSFAGNGSGTVIGLEPAPGEPPVDCHWNGSEIDEGVPGPGECKSETNSPEPPDGIELEAEAGPGSEFAGWTVESGVPFECPTPLDHCIVLTFGEPIKVKAEFVEPDVHIEISGSGAGEVFGTGKTEGNPPVACVYESPGPQTGACDVNSEEDAGFFGITTNHEAAPGSEFAGWKVIKGTAVACEQEDPEAGTCGVIKLGGQTEIVIQAIFEAEPVALTINTGGGTGSGEVNCQVVGGSLDEPCASEYPGGTELELISAPDTGSELGTVSGTNSASGCTSLPCTITLSEASEVNAAFDLETFTLTTEAFGAGEVTAPGIACTEAGNGGVECEETFTYGTNVVVTATPEALNSVGSLTGSGSASESCSLPGPEAAGTCEFEITENSKVVAEFAAAESIESKSANVHGEVPQNTTLEFTEDEEGNTCADVDLGIFQANAQEDVTYAKTCGLIVTATGAENVLSAEDESETSTGHLVNSGYELTQPLETQAEGLPGLLFPGEGGGTLASLESVVDLLTYGGPVNSDNVTLEFSQLINEHDPLYTGEYAKQITLTLEQTAL